MFVPSTYTVESVTSGHPDKICDAISDAVLDECLRQDPQSRVAVEAFGGHGIIMVGGEVSTRAAIDPAEIAQRVYRDIGHSHEVRIITNIARQSPDIAQGVDSGGAGDQGIMYGYATNETPEYLPYAVVLAHQLTRGLENLRRTKTLSWLRPDGKAQVTIRNGRTAAILVSCQHDASVGQEEIRESIIQHLIQPFVPGMRELSVLINPTGLFVQGGFEADTGLTGRKIMVDTYGGLVPHGGGAFSGKDATKVDRSAAYMARYAAKNLVAHGYAQRLLISVAYAIGKVEPVMIEAIDEKGKSVAQEVVKRYDFRPQAIIELLGLRRPVFRETAAYGHFGREGLPWETVDA